MDMEKFIDYLLDSEDLKDIPIDYVFRVVIRIFEIINAGDCFYPLEGGD